MKLREKKEQKWVDYYSGVKPLLGLREIGFTKIFEYLENKINLEEAIDKIKTNSRRYAKRQLTWFKSNKKVKISEGLKLAGDVVGGDVGKVKAVKKGIDIARGNSESQSTKSLEEQIKQAEKAAKNRSTKISRETANVRPTIGPVAPPEFFKDEETKKNKKQKVKSFFARSR